MSSDRLTGSSSSSREASSTARSHPPFESLWSGVVRVADLLVLKKDADGSPGGVRALGSGPERGGELRSYENELALLLSGNHVTAAAAAVEPNSSAAVLVWENTWAAPFASAVRHSGGQLVASGRIPKPCPPSPA